MVRGLCGCSEQEQAVAEKKNNPPQAPELLTPGEVAVKLRVTAEQVRRLIREGKLAAANVGTGPKRPLYRIAPKDLQAFLSRRWQHGPAVRPHRAKRLPPVPDFFPGL